ncbi:DUF6273 domain-containing protein [Fusibacter sp. 3D3]|uniref:DUF6273 domain-containing protein n=1 Tax=Fusibacter sp. 3D3 TaxID=1048380 RepID=UPI0008536AF8|nr:DUF6273 domain-containing protein [Fusibacter sp. 3D3]GAU78876.1 hypothetical protein F3D3_3512 [Fusibacter sp. 3D3]
MKIGDQVVFGDYEWRILDVQDDKALILTEEIIELRDYHNKGTDITWKDCELRKYLNGEFYQKFKVEDRAKIMETVNINPGNLWYKADGGEDTTDRIFILSIDEVVRTFFGDSSRLLDFPSKNQRYWFQRKDENNIKRRAKYMNSMWWWWIRTPGKHNRVAVYIHGDGNIGIQGNGVSKRKTNVIHHLTNDSRGGIRPALWIKK